MRSGSGCRLDADWMRSRCGLDMVWMWSGCGHHSLNILLYILSSMLKIYICIGINDHVTDVGRDGTGRTREDRATTQPLN